MNQTSIATVHQQETGAALIVTLIILLILTLIGIAGMDETVLESRMVLNFRERQAAIESADSALRANEKWLNAQAQPPEPKTAASCAPPLCGGTAPVVWHKDALSKTWDDRPWSWWKANAMPYRGSGAGPSSIANVLDQPAGVIELIAYDPPDSAGYVEVTDPDERSRRIGPHYYNLISSSPGYQEKTQSTLQSTYVKRF